MESFKNLLEPERFPCMTKVWKPVIPTLKDRYLSPDELKQTVFHSPRIIELIKELSGNDEIKRHGLEKQVQDMLNEMGLARSMPIIRWTGVCLNKILKRICHGIYVNETSITNMKSVMGSTPFLYLPSHRSYADFILMSYICFAYDFEIPGIAAGMDFYSMVGLGSVLRKTGAFFMRRSFASDRLYWNVFKEYIRSLVSVYHTGVEFFVEGTRSRSLKALMPKVGLLSMALEPLYMGEVSDITIVPVGVAYEKPLEEQLFVYELLGVPKPKESTMGLFKALKILETSHGDMYINFGEPISVCKHLKSDLDRLKHTQIPIHVQHLTKDEINIISKLAQLVVSRQQQLIVLTTFNLVAVYINYRMYLGEKTTLDELSRGVLELGKFFKGLGALVSVENYNVKSKVLDSINIHSNIMQLNQNGIIELIKPIAVNVQNIDETRLKGYNLSQNIIRFAVPVISLQLYCNPCMYWLAAPAFLILAANKLSDSNRTKESLSNEINKLKTIFSMEFIYEDDESHNIDFLLNQFISMGIMQKDTYQINNSAIFTNIFLSSIVPFMFCYMQVVETIVAQFFSAPFTEKDLFVKVQQKVENDLNNKSNSVHPYCLSLDSISIALNSFQSNNILEKSKSPPVVYTAIQEPLLQLKVELIEFCKIFSYTNLNSYSVHAKL